MVLDEQGRAGRSIGLMHDLPIGFDPGVADAWACKTCLPKALRWRSSR